MILGIGVDLIDVERIRQSLEKLGQPFVNRIFLPSEVRDCKKKASPFQSFAVRFAAKEAVSKAFGTGIGKKLGWKDIEIVGSKTGKPSLVFHGKAKKLAKKCGVTQTHLSLSHQKKYAIAMVILTSNNESIAP